MSPDARPDEPCGTLMRREEPRWTQRSPDETRRALTRRDAP